MTPTPNPRVQDLPMIRSDLAALAQQTRRIALQIQGADELSLDHLKQMTKSMHVVFDFLEELLPGLNALSLELLSEDEQTLLESTFLEFRKVRGAVMASLERLGSLGASALKAGPGLFSTPEHAPVEARPARFPGDWALPEGATLRAVFLVELPKLEQKNPAPGPRFKGGDHLTVAYEMRGDPELLVRVATRMRFAQGSLRAREKAEWFDGEISAPLPEALSKLRLVAESLATQAGQTVRYQELNANREELLRVLERERPRWGAFVRS